MHRRFISVILLSVGLAAWFGLRSWVGSGSESFYLVVPPLCLALAALYSPANIQKWKLRILSGLGFCSFLFLTLSVASYLIFRDMVPGASETFWSFMRLDIWELLASAYFLLGLILILVMFLDFLRRVVSWLDRRFQAKPMIETVTNRGRRLLVRVLPVILLVPFVLPYLQAVMFVRRFKVPNPQSPQEMIGRAYEDVTFVTSDHLRIRGWFLEAKKEPSARTLIICHGLGANRSNFIGFVVVGDALDANVLIFDFRGHGESDGHTVSVGYWEKLDVLAAAAYLREKRPGQARELYGLGISMGSAALIGAAAEIEPPFDGVIVDSAFASAIELTDSMLAQFPASIRPWMAGTGIPLASLHAGCWLSDVRPIDQIAHIRAPLAIIHAEGDPMIPPDHARRLYQQAVEPKWLWIAPTQGHSSALAARTEYLQTVRKVLRHP